METNLGSDEAIMSKNQRNEVMKRLTLAKKLKG
jgi:hypothetical protein